MWFQKIFGFVWTGAINWYLKDLVTVPLICWLRSALIYLQQKEISHLHSRNLPEITATNNLTRSAYARSAYQGYKLGCVRLRNPDFWFWNRTRNPKTDFISEKSVLRVKGWIRISWISFLPLDWEIRKRICKTILVNSGLLFANYACTCKTTVLQDSLSNPFSDFPIERYKRNLKTDISNPKSGFYDLNPDFPIESTLKKRNIAMWSAQYDCWKKKKPKKQTHQRTLGGGC